MITERVESLLADKTYDVDAIRKQGRRRPSAEAVIPARSNRSSPASHDKEKYQLAQSVERLFNKLKNWRRVATRYDKTASSYLGFVVIASVKMWIPFVHET